MLHGEKKSLMKIVCIHKRKLDETELDENLKKKEKLFFFLLKHGTECMDATPKLVIESLNKKKIVKVCKKNTKTGEKKTREFAIKKRTI